MTAPSPPRPLAPAARPVALVTGASSGIGAAFARRLAADGHDLVLVARRAARLAALAEEVEARHGVHVETLAADLAGEAGAAAVEARLGRGAPFAWLVNSAGFGTRGLFAEIPAPRLTEQLRVHVEATVRLTRAVLPGMVAAGRGTVVNVSSLGAFFTTARYANYSATKVCVNMLTEGLRAELRGTGVRVIAVCPGLTRTEFLMTPEYAGFDYGAVPDWVWMSAEDVVEETLGALHAGRTIHVPGRMNRAFVGIMQTPIVGGLVRRALDRLGRDRPLF
jgi:hypothetical protein